MKGTRPCEVMTAGHGAAALESVPGFPPDLVVTDMMMPVMDGAELIRRLRADPNTARIPILAATADIELAGGADAALRESSNEPPQTSHRALRPGEYSPNVIYPRVRECADDGNDVAVACRVLNVSRSG